MTNDPERTPSDPTSNAPAASDADGTGGQRTTATRPTSTSAGRTATAGAEGPPRQEPAREEQREPGAPKPDAPPRPGFREQWGRTRSAAGSLVGAHVDLLKAELSEIFAQLKTLSVLGGLVLALGLFLANLVLIGTALFLGEWLFGSLGWGVLHGTLLITGVLTALVLVILGARAGRLAFAFLISALLGVLVAILLGTNVVRRGAELVAAQVAPSLALDPAVLPTLTTVVIGAVLVGVVGLVLGARGGGFKGAVAGLVGGVVLGALIGWVVGLEQPWHVAAALGVTVAFLLWPVLQYLMARGMIAPRERFGRLVPRETYEAALETRVWLGERWADRRKTLARR